MYYVYVFLDPRKSDWEFGEYKFDHEPFYIGKGKGIGSEPTSRPYNHLYEARTGMSTNPLKVGIINKIIEECKTDPPFVIFKNGLSEEEAYKLEWKLISDIGRRDLGTGPLANMSEGGDGGTGQWSDERKKEFSIKQKEVQNRPKLIRNNREKGIALWKDPAYRERVIKAVRESVKTTDHRELQRQLSLERYSRPENRKRHAELMKKIHSTPEARKKNSESKKIYFQNEYNRLKHGQMQKEVQNREEVKKKNSESTKKWWADPKNREMMAEARRKKKEEKLKNESEA